MKTILLRGVPKGGGHPDHFPEFVSPLAPVQKILVTAPDSIPGDLSSFRD